MVDDKDKAGATGNTPPGPIPPKVDLSKRIVPNAEPESADIKSSTIRLDIPADPADTPPGSSNAPKQPVPPAAMPTPAKPAPTTPAKPAPPAAAPVAIPTAKAAPSKKDLNTTIRLDTPHPVAAKTPAKPAPPAAAPVAIPTAKAAPSKKDLDTTIQLGKPSPATGESNKAPSAAGPSTVRLKKPAAAGQVAQSVPLSKKKDTSRIPLDAATPKNAEVDEPTIKISPTSDAKRKTSRISLEAALSVQEDGKESQARPKTIRLKSPDEMPTVKMKPAPEAKGGESTAPRPELNKTAKLNIDEDEESPTRKKTIVVKRPTQRPSVKGGVTLAKKKGVKVGAGSSGEEGAEPVVITPTVTAPVDKPLWVFHTLSIVAILTMCVVIYLFSAQAFGPNYSLTKLSYGAPNLNLAWPNKLVSRQY